jgi:DNA-binding sugar fermentation-stimulating protein
VGARFTAPVQTGPGAHPTSHIVETGPIPGAKRPWRDVDYPPHPAQRLKKEYSYTSTLSLGLRGLL